MPYRLCTFDSLGKIVSITPESYPDNSIVVSEALYYQPGAYSFVDESLIPTDVLARASELDSETQDTENNGTELSFRLSNESRFYDPRVEATLFMENSFPYILRNTPILQDITKATAVWNTQDSTTRPKHDNSVYRTGLGSCRFTRSLTGYTGGMIRVTNLSKRDQGQVTGILTYSAPHDQIAGGGTFSYAVEMYFRPTSLANDFTLVQKGLTGASANWKISFDSSVGILQFAWASYDGKAGYNNTMNIATSAGLTTNGWNHLAVAAVRNGSSTGSYLISTYLNGSNTTTKGVTFSTFPEVRWGGGILIGNNSDGNEPFDGHIDMFRLLESPSTGGIFGTGGYGFLPFGSGTLGVPTLNPFSLNAESAFNMNFDGLQDTSEFYCQSDDYIAAVALRVLETDVQAGISSSQSIGVFQVVRHALAFTGGFTGIPDSIGFSMGYGSITVPFSSVGNTGTQAYDYSFRLNGVFDNNATLSDIKTTYRNQALFEYGISTLKLIEGASGNRGSSGSPMASAFGRNPFRRLFSNGGGNCYGGTLAYSALFIDPRNQQVMSFIMDSGFLATQGVCLSAYRFVDGRGITRTVGAKEISDLRLDLIEYNYSNRKPYDDLVIDLSSASTKNDSKMRFVNDFASSLYGNNVELGKFGGRTGSGYSTSNK